MVMQIKLGVVYDKYAYFYFYYYCFFILLFFFFCSLIVRDKYLLFYKRAILSFGYHVLTFLSVVFSLRTKRVTSQHKL